ncbi:MAG: hypothetical protein LBL07_16960 [Tannerella sp.]|nr:hypothetical protein [Tannerella sp.]
MHCTQILVGWGIRTPATVRLRTDISFDGKDTGRRFELMAAWINPRLQHGPWSHELSGVIN